MNPGIEPNFIEMAATSANDVTLGAPGSRPVDARRAVELRYVFSLGCRLSSTTPPPIQVPGGTRVQLSYLPEGSKVEVRPEQFRATWRAEPSPRLGETSKEDRQLVEELADKKDRKELRELLNTLAERARQRLAREGAAWAGLEGTIKSGTDALFVREDGVALLDGRFTLRDANGFLIGAIASGAVDIAAALPGNLSGPDAYQAFRAGPSHGRFPEEGLPLRLALRFEVSTDPGRALDFAAPRYIVQALDHWKYERLGRALFLGVGRLTVKREPHWPAERLDLDVFELGAAT